MNRILLAVKLLRVAKLLDAQDEEIPSWAEAETWDKRLPYAKEWVQVAGRNVGLKNSDWVVVSKYSPNHIALQIGTQDYKTKLFLQEALNRSVEPYREGWLIADREAKWLGLRSKDWAFKQSKPLTFGVLKRRLK